MKYFNVTVSLKGKKRIELIKAKSKMAALKMAKLNFPNQRVSKAVEVAKPTDEKIRELVEGVKKSFEGKINIDNKISAIRQISVMTDAGISIHDAINEVAVNTENPKLKKIFENIGSDINAGKSIADSMDPYADEFGHVTIAMTNLGEKTGNIASSYAKLATILEDIRDNLKKFKKAIRTPMITLIAMGIAFTILIMVVVPKFKEMFEKFQSDLPVPTIILLWLENALSNYGLYILVGMAVGIFLLIHFHKTDEKFRYKVDKIMVNPKFYLIHKIVFFSSMHKYMLVFGELVKSGIPVSEALDTAVDMVDNAYIKEKLLGVNANIARGISLSDAFEQTGLFENMLLQMIRAGEAGGQLDAMLGKVTDYYDARFQDLIDNLASYIEPIMLFFIAGLVLLLALGIFMPMWDLGKAVK